MIDHIKTYKMTYSTLTVLLLLSFFQGLFNYKEHFIFRGTITASSHQPSPEFSPLGILDGSTLWHTKAEFPQWVQFNPVEPAILNHLGIMSQGDSPGGSEHRRAPQDFIFQGSHDGQTWEDLLKVNNAIYHSGNQWISWNFKNETRFTYYRIHIFANNGDTSLLTIAQINLN